jgi:hypothetical protein
MGLLQRTKIMVWAEAFVDTTGNAPSLADRRKARRKKLADVVSWAKINKKKLD